MTRSKNKEIDRRAFIKFLGTYGAGLAILPLGASSCKSLIENANFSIVGIGPSDLDELKLAEGLAYQILASRGEDIGNGERFGSDCDYTCFLPDPKDKDRGLLWVNHESLTPLFVNGRTKDQEPNLQQVNEEMYEIGGGFIGLERIEGKWQLDTNHPLAKRFTAQTEFDIHWPEKIAGTDTIIGTLANCAGGHTPWGTILTCEENYHYYFGERNWETAEVIQGGYGWEKHYNRPPEHYGWVVEIDPVSGTGRKLIALGRCAHECATVRELEDGRVVIYSGDDKAGECLYRYVSRDVADLENGELFVANLEKSRWESLDINKRTELSEVFNDQTEVLIRLREAAKLVGGSALDRPEDIEIDPLTGDFLVTLTNNTSKGNHFGSILKIKENGAYDGLTFESETFLTGGEESGFACPDNLAFDKSGNLWFTSDISGYAMNKSPYEAFKNNGLFLVPRSGPHQGEVIQMASAPTDAEFTGTYFDADEETLFLSVQHPGERSSNLQELTSTWPTGKGTPLSSVVTITGDLLKKITHMNVIKKNK